MTFLPHRELGRTGFRATRLGIGDLADRTLPLATCVTTLRRALDRGLNLVDTAPNYEDGFSEQIVGAALRGRARHRTFVVTKIDHPDQPVAPQLDASLARLGLDHVDLVVFHALSTPDGLARVLAPGGGFDQLADEQRRGRVRYRGISSHHPAVLRTAIEAGVCDVVMFPLGPFVDRRYEDDVLPLCRARGTGSICFKTFGAGKLVADTLGYQRPLERPASAPPLPRLAVEECVRYTLTLDPDVALLGLSTPAEQDAAWAAAAAFTAMPPGELAATRERAAAAIADKGDVWWNPQPQTAPGDDPDSP